MDGDILNDELPAIPCGLVAKSVFNDSFILRKEDDTKIEINEQNIAWSSDVQYKFKNIQNAPDG